jgi:hypothetical protein
LPAYARQRRELFNRQRRQKLLFLSMLDEEIAFGFASSVAIFATSLLLASPNESAILFHQLFAGVSSIVHLKGSKIYPVP